MVESVSTVDDALELDAHGFALGTEVQFRAAGGGGLPVPLSHAVKYYASPVDDWRFQISLAPGGVAVNLTSEGTTFLVLAPVPVEAAIERASRVIDDMLPSSVVPLIDPVADIIRMSTAELAAYYLTASNGTQTKSLTEVYDATRRRVERWARHVPVRGENAPPTAQRSVIATSTNRSAWSRFAGIS